MPIWVTVPLLLHVTGTVQYDKAPQAGLEGRVSTTEAPAISPASLTPYATAPLVHGPPRHESWVGIVDPPGHCAAGVSCPPDAVASPTTSPFALISNASVWPPDGNGDRVVKTPPDHRNDVPPPPVTAPPPITTPLSFSATGTGLVTELVGATSTIAACAGIATQPASSTPRAAIRRHFSPLDAPTPLRPGRR